MAKIVDPDQLTQNTEVTFDAGAKTIDLAIAGNLDDDAPGKTSGVTHQALYSFTKEEWLTTAALRKVRFPFKAIFEAKFEWVNSWQPNDAQTNDLIRDGGFRVVVLDDEYACIISLGSMDAPSSDLAYYQQVAGFDQTTTDFDKTGELNENILIFDGSNDYRDFLKTYLRELNKTFSEGNLLVDQDLTALTYQAYRLPLANADDPNYTLSDATIDGSSPYTEMEVTYLLGNTFETWGNSETYPAGAVVLDPIRQSGGSSNGTWWFTPAGGTTSGTGTLDDTGITDWESYVGEQQIGDEWFAFNRIIQMTSGTGEILEFYNWAQRQLRKSTDINADSLGTPNQDGYGTVYGEVARLLCDFVGVDLVTRPGVFIDDLDPNDINNIKFYDITVDGGGLDSEDVPLTSTERAYPYVSAFNLVFSDEIVAETDGDTYFTMFFLYTTRYTNTDFATTSPTGDTYTLTSGTLDLTTMFSNGDYAFIQGFANSGNNGYFVLASVVSGSMDCTRVDGQNVGAAEGVGPSVSLDNNPYDTPDAIIVQDASDVDIAGQVTAAIMAKTFDYDGNVQGGRTAGTDAAVAVEVSGLISTWVDGTFTIAAATGVNFPLNPAEDGVYLNP
jgi:hypothetical protein